MAVDKELVDDFCNEIVLIKGELSGYIANMIKPKMEQVDPIYFSKYGNAIDRIYGTAATLGYTDIASYCLAMKEVTYMASQSDSELGRKKTIKMMIESVALLEELINAIYDQSKLKLYKNKIIMEVKRVERMNRQEFYSITKKSC